MYRRRCRDPWLPFHPSHIPCSTPRKPWRPSLCRPSLRGRYKSRCRLVESHDCTDHRSDASPSSHLDFGAIFELTQPCTRCPFREIILGFECLHNRMIDCFLPVRAFRHNVEIRDGRGLTWTMHTILGLESGFKI